MSGPVSNKKEKEFINRISKFEDQVMMPPEDAVMEGFEFFETKEYLDQKGSVNRKKSLIKMLTGYGTRQFIKTATAMGSNIGDMIRYSKKNYLDVEPLISYLEENGHFPLQSKNLMDSFPNETLWNELKSYAFNTHGIHIGFCKVTEDMIFKGKAVPFKYALVCIQEMNKEAFEEEPIVAAGREVVKVYNELGIASNDIAEWLRKHSDVHCMANHPYGGLIDYVPLAERAGLGRNGHNGLLITPYFGTRHRISPILFQEKIFEFTDTEDYTWIDDFCMACRACERKCPTGAIYPEPNVTKENAFDNRPRALTIDKEKCFTYFSLTLGCSECIRVCPFVKKPYEMIRRGWEKNLLKEVKSIDTNDLDNMKEPKRIAVVGSGASGIFATEDILAKTIGTTVDIYEALPVPFGLVRYGVAPDHSEVKEKAFYFHDVIRHKRVNFFGNIKIGVDIQLDELRQSYDSVIIATGASKGRNLGIVGEKLKGSFTAPEIVNWYNCHPEYQSQIFPSKVQQVTMIGMGNVTLDISRMLCKAKEKLERTTISDLALEQMKAMKIKEIHIFARRGPYEAKYTPKELLELIELPNVEPSVHGFDFEKTTEQADEQNNIDQELSNFRLFDDISKGKYKSLNKHSIKMIFHFYYSPVEVKGQEWVEQVKFEKMNMKSGQLNGSKEFLDQASDMFITSIGYKSDKIAGIPSQDKNGIINNQNGRVCDEENLVIPGLYCSGWIRRGPSGIIGTNKIDAKEVVELVLDEFIPATKDNISLKKQLKDKFVSKEDMNEILMLERNNGSRTHKRARKFHSVDEMLKVKTNRGLE